MLHSLKRNVKFWYHLSFYIDLPGKRFSIAGGSQFYWHLQVPLTFCHLPLKKTNQRKSMQHHCNQSQKELLVSVMSREPIESYKAEYYWDATNLPTYPLPTPTFAIPSNLSTGLWSAVTSVRCRKPYTTDSNLQIWPWPVLLAVRVDQNGVWTGTDLQWWEKLWDCRLKSRSSGV